MQLLKRVLIIALLFISFGLMVKQGKKTVQKVAGKEELLKDLQEVADFVSDPHATQASTSTQDAVVETLEDINIEVAEGTVVGHVHGAQETPREVVDGLIVGNIYGSADDNASTADQVPTGYEVPSASTTPTPTFEKKKVVKKIGDTEQAFIDKCNNANDDERKKFMDDLLKEAKVVQDKIEWLKQSFNMEAGEEDQN